MEFVAGWGQSLAGSARGWVCSAAGPAEDAAEPSSGDRGLGRGGGSPLLCGEPLCGSGHREVAAMEVTYPKRQERSR